MLKIVRSHESKIPEGSIILAIDNHNIDDFLEFEFYNDIVKTRKVLMKLNGKKKSLIFKPQEKIAIAFEEPTYRQCENNCDFCFVNGLPKGLRKKLYFRDDDYRLSFLFGNFLSLTNFDEKDISRIGRLRLSPLYVSVHTTDPILRSKIFKNNKAALIMKQVGLLVDQNIKLHCQIVIMPGITDGNNLIKTINDLSSLHPGVSSIGVVPVGKTRYLKGISLVSKISAKKTTGIVEEHHKKFRRKYKRGIVYLADEFYIKAGYSIPETSYYDDFPQYENGIGMVRTFIDEVKSLSRIRMVKGKNLMLTSCSAFSYLKMLKARLLRAGINNIDILPIENRFFGKTVTVSGLLSAKDFSRTIENLKKHYDRIILPPNCTNDSGKFIDDKTIDDKRAIVASGSIRELLKCLQS